MTISMQPPTSNDDLPYHKKVAADLLAAGLDLLGGRHPGSWEEGHKSALNEIAAQRPNEPQAVRITLEYRSDHLASVPQRDSMIFGLQRLNATAESKSKMRADAGRYLAPDQQPTADQWKGVFSGSATTSIVGAAGTGKTLTLLLRVIYLHLYLHVPLTEITILTLSRESRQDTATELQRILEAWKREISLEAALGVVKTARSAVIEQIRSVAGLAGSMPFEVLSDAHLSALDDGRPFDSALTDRQRMEMEKCFNTLYRSNKRFAELVRAMFAASLRVRSLPVDHPEVVKRAPLAWKLSEVDGELCDTVEALWTNAGMWPLEGIQAARKQFSLRGRVYSCSGYVPQLNMHVVLGFDRSEDRYTRRSPTEGLETYKEVAIKRTLLQSYFGEPLIHLDSYHEARALVEALKAIATTPPAFEYSLGGSCSLPLLVLYNEAATLIDTLGLEVATVPGRLNFLANDPDAAFFESLAIFWQVLERSLALLDPPSFPYGRLFDLLSDRHAETLRYVPMAVLGQYRHVLVDNAEDHPVPVGNWLRGVFSELRGRDASQDVTSHLCATLTAAGDVCQWVYGTFGTSPKLLTDVEELFTSSSGGIHIQLMESFRSHQLLVDAGQNLMRNQSTAWGRATKAAARAARDPAPVMMLEMEPAILLSLCLDAFKDNRKVLVLINDDQDRAWVDGSIGDLIREERAAGGQKIRVRPFRKAKALEADVVILVGDPAAGASRWYRNQLYRLAGFCAGGDVTPADTVEEGEALRLAYVAITRARRRAYWFPNRAAGSAGRSATTLTSMSTELFRTES